MKKTTLLAALALLLSLLLLPFNSNAARPKNIGILSETQSRSVSTNLGLFGGEVMDIAIDSTNSNNVYITTKAPNGFFSSLDGGQTWQGLPTGSDYGNGGSVEINSANGDIYATLGGSVIKSTDNGSTFTKLAVNTAGGTLLFSNNKLFVNGSGKVSISSDGGNSFSSKIITTGDDTVIWAFAGASDGSAYYAVTENEAQTSGKLYKSTDGGSTWSNVAIPNFVPWAVAVNPNNASHVVIIGEGSNIYQSFDGGSSWSSKAGGSSVVAFDASGRLYVGPSYLDSPYTSSLTDLNTDTGVTKLSGYAIAADPNNTSIIYISTSAGVAKSINRGSTWTDYNQGITSVTVNDISQANNKAVTWAATNNGLAKSTNFTSASPSWTFPVNVVLNPSSGISAVWVKPDDPNIVLAAYHDGVYRSADGGSTWSQASIPASTKTVNRIIANSNNILYATHASSDRDNNTGGVITSTDLGQTWTDTGMLDSPPSKSIAISGDGSLYVGVGVTTNGVIRNRGIYKYSGGTWQKLSAAPNYEVQTLLADPDNANVIYAGVGDRGGEGFFYKTSDGGTTWQKITNGLSSLSAPSSLTLDRMTSPNSLYLGVNYLNKGTLFKSSDGGNSWGVFYQGLDGEEFKALLFDGLVAGNNRGLYSIKSRASIGIASYKRVVQKVKRKGKIKNKVRYLRLKTVKKGALVYLKVSLQDAATKKKLKKRTVLLYKKVIVKRKIKKKWRRVARWKLIKRLKMPAKGYTFIKTRFGSTTVYYAKWKPANSSDKEEYTTSKSKSVKVKVKK